MSGTSPLNDALDDALNSMTSEVCPWMLTWFIYCLILCAVGDLVPNGLCVWEETTFFWLSAIPECIFLFSAIGILSILYIVGYFTLCITKRLGKDIWHRTKILATVLRSGMSERYASSVGFAREVLSNKVMPVAIYGILQTGKWLNSAHGRLSVLHSTLATVSGSACKTKFASLWKAFPAVMVFSLFHASQAVDAAYASPQSIRSLSAISARKARSWLAEYSPASISWSLNEIETNIPTTNRRARLDSRALDQAYDMLLKSSEVFNQLNCQQKVDAIKFIVEDIVNFENGVGHVYAPRKAFHIAAQMIEFHCGVNRDHFEFFMRMKVCGATSEMDEQARSIFAVFIYSVFMITCGHPTMEKSPNMSNQTKGGAEDEFAEKGTENLGGREQCAEATSETLAHQAGISSDSGYGGSP